MFCVLPFGLSTACYVFTKLLHPLIKKWRSQSLRCIVYIDNGICASESKQHCITSTKHNIVMTWILQASFYTGLNQSLNLSKLAIGLVSNLTLAKACFLSQMKKFLSQAYQLKLCTRSLIAVVFGVMFYHSMLPLVMS